MLTHLNKGMFMQEENDVLTTKGPGEKLKRARESFGLSTWDVASQLYLPERVMIALEEDDYHAHLPARAFVRGYLRSYSKLLKLSPEEILSEFDALGIYKTPQEESLKTLSQPRVALTIHKDKFWFGVVGGSILGILVLIVTLTCLNTRQEKNEDIINQVLQEEEKNTTPEVVAEPILSESLSNPNSKDKAPAGKKLSENTFNSSGQDNHFVSSVDTATVSAPVEPIISVEQAQVIHDQQQMTSVDTPLPVAQLSVN